MYYIRQVDNDLVKYEVNIGIDILLTTQSFISDIDYNKIAQNINDYKIQK